MSELKVPVAVVVLTFNEEANIYRVLHSVLPYAGQVFVVDSFSNDATVEIAEKEGARVFQRKFDNFSAQRNWAIENLPFMEKWVLFLDADERIPEALWREIALKLPSSDGDGFYLNRRLVMFGTWLRWGGAYPSWHLRLFRLGKGQYEERSVNENLIVYGKTEKLKEDFIHEDAKGMHAWLDRHNRYSTLEASICVEETDDKNQLKARFWGSQAERKRFLRRRVWNHLPFRPMLWFLYSYMFRLGFLHGRAGYRYARLLSIYQFFIDLKIEEMRAKRKP
jgi:glycosyltransferase involved in cell wall biosynthesis